MVLDNIVIEDKDYSGVPITVDPKCGRNKVSTREESFKKIYGRYNRERANGSDVVVEENVSVPTEEQQESVVYNSASVISRLKEKIEIEDRAINPKERIKERPIIIKDAMAKPLFSNANYAYSIMNTETKNDALDVEEDKPTELSVEEITENNAGNIKASIESGSSMFDTPVYDIDEKDIERRIDEFIRRSKESESSMFDAPSDYSGIGNTIDNSVIDLKENEVINVVNPELEVSTGLDGELNPITDEELAEAKENVIIENEEQNRFVGVENIRKAVLNIPSKVYVSTDINKVEEEKPIRDDIVSIPERDDVVVVEDNAQEVVVEEKSKIQSLEDIMNRYREAMANYRESEEKLQRSKVEVEEAKVKQAQENERAQEVQKMQISTEEKVNLLIEKIIIKSEKLNAETEENNREASNALYDAECNSRYSEAGFKKISAMEGVIHEINSGFADTDDETVKVVSR